MLTNDEWLHLIDPLARTVLYPPENPGTDGNLCLPILTGIL